MSEATSPSLELIRDLIAQARQLSEAAIARLEGELSRERARITALETTLTGTLERLRKLEETAIRAEGRNEGAAGWTAKIWQIAAPLLTALLAAAAGAFWARVAP